MWGLLPTYSFKATTLPMPAEEHGIYITCLTSEVNFCQKLYGSNTDCESGLKYSNSCSNAALLLGIVNIIFLSASVFSAVKCR